MKILIPFFLLFIIFSACENKNDYDINDDKNYESGKQNLEKTEKKNPTSFLSVKGDRKRNLIGQSVITGQITNLAKIVSFKDIDVKIFSYSKTGALLGEDHEIVYETILPGGIKKFRSKYFTPKGTDSVSLKIIGAKF